MNDGNTKDCARMKPFLPEISQLASLLCRPEE